MLNCRTVTTLSASTSQHPIDQLCPLRTRVQHLLSTMFPLWLHQSNRSLGDIGIFIIKYHQWSHHASAPPCGQTAHPQVAHHPCPHHLHHPRRRLHPSHWHLLVFSTFCGNAGSGFSVSMSLLSSSNADKGPQVSSSILEFISSQTCQILDKSPTWSLHDTISSIAALQVLDCFGTLVWCVDLRSIW